MAVLSHHLSCRLSFLVLGARAQAAGGAVDKLGALIEELDEKAQGKFSVRLMLSARDLNTLRSSALAAQRIFIEMQADVMEETLGNLSAFCFTRNTVASLKSRMASNLGAYESSRTVRQRSGGIGEAA